MTQSGLVQPSAVYATLLLGFQRPEAAIGGMRSICVTPAVDAPLREPLAPLSYEERGWG